MEPDPSSARPHQLRALRVGDAPAAWAAAGAMTFDGLAIGFIPGLYGQTGQALAWTAAALLFAFASLLVAGQVMLGRDVPASR